MLFKLAWRNIWRNKRRTLITVASILFAVLLASFMESLQKGAWNNMINNVVNYYYGYVQIHKKGYWEEQSIENSFVAADTLYQLKGNKNEPFSLVPRLESFALASQGNKTKGVLVVGIDPEKEDELTSLKSRLVEGEYIKDEGLLVAEEAARFLNIKVKDTLVLVSQGYHGVNAAGKFAVKGIIHFGSPQLNQQMVYMPIKDAQWFYGAENLITSLALKIENRNHIAQVVRTLKLQLNQQDYEVMDWQELLPELLQAKALDSAGNYIVYFILYLVIAFGIFGTILMMTKERSYEFGVLVAIGMQRFKLAAIVWMETMVLGLIGALSGIAASIPIVLYFRTHPIRFSGEMAGALQKFGFEPVFPTEFNAWIFLTQAIIVLVITSILAIYPILILNRLQPVAAMRTV